MMNVLRISRHVATLLLLGALAGCATLSLTPHPGHSGPIVLSGNYMVSGLMQRSDISAAVKVKLVQTMLKADSEAHAVALFAKAAEEKYKGYDLIEILATPASGSQTPQPNYPLISKDFSRSI